MDRPICSLEYRGSPWWGAAGGTDHRNRGGGESPEKDTFHRHSTVLLHGTGGKTPASGQIGREECAGKMPLHIKDSHRKHQEVHPRWIQCWSSVCDAGPALNPPWVFWDVAVLELFSVYQAGFESLLFPSRL